jgi:hypothetical protein
VEIDDTKKTFAFTNKYGIASLSNINGDDSNKTYQVIVSKEGYITTTASAISYNNREITVELKKAGGNAKPFWKKRQVQRIFWVSFILIAITASAYLGNAYYQGNKDLAAYKEKTELMYGTNVLKYRNEVNSLNNGIVAQRELMADKIEKDGNLSKQFRKVEENIEVIRLLKVNAPIYEAIKHLESLEDTVVLQKQINEYYDKLETAYQEYKALYDALPKVEAKKVGEEEKDKPNVEPTEPKGKTAKEKLDEGNIARKKELIEYSKGLCSNKSDDAQRYKVEVQNNKIGFTKKEQGELVENFQTIYDLLTTEYRLKQRINITDNLRRLEKIDERKLSKLQLNFLNDLKEEYALD